jgi:hypothetical protein
MEDRASFRFAAIMVSNIPEAASNYLETVLSLSSNCIESRQSGAHATICFDVARHMFQQSCDIVAAQQTLAQLLSKIDLAAFPGLDLSASRNQQRQTDWFQPRAEYHVTRAFELARKFVEVDAC